MEQLFMELQQQVEHPSETMGGLEKSSMMCTKFNHLQEVESKTKMLRRDIKKD